VELPRLQPLYEKYRDQGLRIVILEAAGMDDAAKEFIAKKGLTFSFLAKGEGSNDVAKNVFAINSFPTTFILNEEGKIIFAHEGFNEGDERMLEEEILSILN
jgi:peroxiredoxin